MIQPTTHTGGQAGSEVFVPYVAQPALEWAHRLGAAAGPSWQELEGTMVFGDVSGFTKMSERLARHGKVGAEEVTDAINTCFEQLLEVAYDAGGSLLKFGGDALLLYFNGPGHAVRAASAATSMRARLRIVGRLRTTAGLVTLRISIGAHTGTFHAFLVGQSHREFIITGPGASATVDAEGSASAGEIMVSSATAAALPAACRGAQRGDGYLLRGTPQIDEQAPSRPTDIDGIDVASLVPAAIRQHLLSGPTDPEHRGAAIAFVHFDGTDAVIEQHGPGELAQRLDVLVRSVQQAADELNVTFLGTDIDHDGGKIILVSGVPRRAGEDEDRLLLALRRIVDSDPPVPVRIGVHSGPVFAADVGSSYRRTFTVMGDTVNLAARVMSRAAPGHILATPDVLSRCRRVFQTTPLEPFAVKGKRAPVTALDVGPLRREKTSAAHLLPLVGRRQEMDVLQDALDALGSGPGRLVDIVAGAGMGKSRLADELRSLAASVQSITIACEDYDRTTPYAPIRLLGLHLLGLDDAARAGVIAGALASRVGHDAPELAPVLPLIAASLGVDLPDTPETAGLEPEFRRTRINESTAAFLVRVLPQPCVLVIEDVHHMDEVSRELLGALLTAHRDTTSILIVMTRREEGEGEPGGAFIEGDVATHVLRLGPLPDDAVVEALLRATEDAPLLPHEVQALVTRAAGNPLFLESLLQARWDGAAIDELPFTVDAVVNTKIDALPPSQRQLLRCAAVLGQVFTLTELTDILDPGHDPPDHATLQDLGDFMVMDSAGVLRFRWTVMRDCAYEALPFRRRRELHGRAARSLATRFGDDADSVSELLSMHFFHAGAFDEAWVYARMAGRRASDRYANVEAVALFERALASARHMPTLEPGEVGDAWEALGDARERAGSYDGAARAYRSARRLCEGLPLAYARLLLKQAWLPERVGRHSEAIRWIRRGLKELEGVEGAEAGRCRAQLLAWCGAVRQSQGRHREAVSWCEAAITQARASDGPAAEAHALFILDWAWVSLDHPERATNSPRALALYEELGNLGGQAVVLNNLGGFAYGRGHWDEAITYYTQGRDARLATGNDVDAASGTCNIGEVLADQGRYEEAEVALNEALRVWRATRYRHGVGFARLVLGRVAARTERFADADASFDAARQEFVTAGLDGEVRMVDASRAENLVLQGRADDALALVDRLLAHTDGSAHAETGTLGPPLERLRGYALLQLGRHEDAHRALIASLDAARLQEAEYELALTLLALARFSQHTGDLGAATRFEGGSTALFERLDIVRVPEYPLSARRTGITV